MSDPNPYGLPVHVPADDATGVLCWGVDDFGGPEMVVCPATPIVTCAACLALVRRAAERFDADKARGGRPFDIERDCYDCGFPRESAHSEGCDLKEQPDAPTA